MGMRRSWLAMGLYLPVVFSALALPAARADLVARWTFDETSGATAHDSAGPIDGTLMNAASFAPGEGISGGAVRLDFAGGGFVTMGDNFGLLGTSFTLQAWIKTDPGESRGFFPVTKHHAGQVAGYFFSINDSGDGGGGNEPNKAHFYQGYPTTGASAITVNDGQWHQLVAVYDLPGGTTTLYVDGAFQNVVGHSPINPNGAPFLVGGIETGAGLPIGVWQGLIDEVRIYDNPLSAGEVRFAFDNPGVVPEPSTLALAGIGACVVLGRTLRRRARRPSPLRG